VADIDEGNGQNDLPPALVARLSREKAAVVWARFQDGVVVGADTVVALDSEILGKPANRGEATAMLRLLRDRPHQVYSGVTVYPAGGGTPLTSVVCSTVWMRPYGDDEIASYVASGDPLDKAGAYGIQNREFHPVARLRGCYASVMGLPLCKLCDLFRQTGVSFTVDPQATCSAFTGTRCCGGGEQDVVFEEQRG
jgi:septum formation protein